QIRSKPPLQIRLPILVHRQPPSKLALHESGKSLLGNPKNHTSAKVVLGFRGLIVELTFKHIGTLIWPFSATNLRL
ncbi:hypothetical protein, partial [Qipengyuania algicida]|uniref:hypothetical protein n=1 Tax=Qipengyuania algicida TaxID=1836209 RepID=UPI001F1949D2